jgi:hypothetical protein
MPPKKKTQAELLELLSEPPFNQRNTVPPDATIINSQPETWWRTDSPRGVPDDEAEAQERQWMSTYKEPEPEGPELDGIPKTGVFSWRKRPEYKSCYQVGYGPATRTAVNGTGTISGYSGFIPGKYAGGSLGCTFNAAGIEAENHLKRTAQAVRYGVSDPEAVYGGDTGEH